jgi:peptidoglycan/xylan/chitin deacetylase (PgdA/CDA1 family)
MMIDATASASRVPAQPDAKTHPIMVRRRWVSGWDDEEKQPARRTRLRDQLLRPISSAICVGTQVKVIALTFDDGPGPGTSQLLDVLAARAVSATFFMLSGAARRQPATVARVLSEGHEIALHGPDHERTTSWPLRKERSILRRAKEELEDVAGRPVGWYRPTYGAQRVTLVRHARALGLETLIWSGWAYDWEQPDPLQVADQAWRTRHPGEVLLLHDHVGDRPEGFRPSPFAAQATEELTRRLAADEWTALTVTELFARYTAVRAAWFA